MIDFFKWLIDWILGVEAVNSAAYNGHLKVVKYLLKHNAPIERRAVFLAGHYGHSDVAKFLEGYLDKKENENE